MLLACPCNNKSPIPHTHPLCFTAMIDGPLQACVEPGVCVAVSVQIKPQPLPESVPNTLTEGEDTQRAHRGSQSFVSVTFDSQSPSITSQQHWEREGGLPSVFIGGEENVRSLSLLSSSITLSSPTLSLHFHSQPFVLSVLPPLTFGLSPVNLDVDVQEIRYSNWTSWDFRLN